MQIERINNEYQIWQTKKDNLVDALIDKSITKDIYDKKLETFNDKIRLLEIELEEHNRADFDYKNTVGTIVSIARRAKSIFENCSEPAKKRLILSQILQNPRIVDGKLDFTMTPAFDLVLKLSEDPTWLPIVDEFRNFNWKKIKQQVELFSNISYFKFINTIS